MGILKVVMSNLGNRRFSSALTTISVAIGVTLLIAILILSSALYQGAVFQGGGYDMIVGPKGSATQLILSTVFHYEVPIGNIDYEVFRKLAADERVTKAIPLALGDNYRNYRIVGTDSTYFMEKEDENINGVIATGRFYEEVGEVVIGHMVAERGGLKIGDKFVGAHGVGDGIGGCSHDHHNEDTSATDPHHNDTHHAHDLEYIVVGILEPQNNTDDYIIFTPVESVWEAHDIHASHQTYYHYKNEGYHLQEEHEEHHEHHEHHHVDKPELTAILIQGRDIVSLATLKTAIEADTHYPAQAAFVAVVLRQLLKVLGDGAMVANVLAYISIIIAALSILISLMSSMAERRKDVAVMRMLGASKNKVLTIVILEAVVITVIGILIGIIGGHTLAHWIGRHLQHAAGIYVNALQYWQGEGITVITVLMLGLLSGLIPALTVYRTEPTKFIDN
ncbi:MAG: ABC transporter permease [Clostridiaceae bacterium]|nr:ABC transporter permease [Clostridiaceae bacterium]